MTFTLIQTSSAFANPATVSSGSAAGNLLVLVLFDQPGVGTPNYTLPSGWQTDLNTLGDGVSGTGEATQIFWYPNNPGGITSALINGGSAPTGYILEFHAGTALTGALDVDGSTVDTSTVSSQAVSTTAQTHAAHELAVAIFFVNYASATKTTLTPGTGFTAAIDVGNAIKQTTHVAVDYELDTGATAVQTITDTEAFSSAAGPIAASIATFTAVPVPALPLVSAPEVATPVQAVPVPRKLRPPVLGSRIQPLSSGYVVTASNGAGSGINLQVVVATGATETGGASAFTADGSTSDGSITPNASNSLILFAAEDGQASTTFTPDANNSLYGNVQDASDGCTLGPGKYTGTVTGGTAVTAGNSAPTAAANSQWAAYELKPSGGTPAQDASTPPNAQGTLVSTIKCNPFNPPPGAVLTALVSANFSGIGGSTNITVSSVPALTWTLRVANSTNNANGFAGVYTATVPGGATHVSDTDASTAADTENETVKPQGSDAAVATDAGESIHATLSSSDVAVASDGSEQIHVSSSDASTAADAGEHLAVTLSDTDASTAADSGTVIKLSNPDVSTAADAGEHIAATLSSSDVSTAFDTENETVRLTGITDASTAADAGEHTSATLSSPDAAVAADASEQIHVTGSDAAQGQENSGNTFQTVTSSDASFATDAGELVKLTGIADAAVAADAGEHVAATLPSSDAAAAHDAGEQVHVSDTDASTALDAGEHVAAALSSSDASTAADSGTQIRLASTDAGIAADAGEHIAATLSDTDVAVGSDAIGVLAQEDSGTDALQAEDGSLLQDEGQPTFIVASLSSSDASTASDGGEFVNTGGHTVHDTETCQAVDSGFTFLSDTDACAASDGNTTITQFVHDSDACTSADAGEHIAGTFLKSDTDACKATETTAFFTGTLFTSDTDSCVATDFQPPNNRIVSDSDACASFDTEHETVEVFTYQPPFRWTGGGFEVVWHVLEGTGEAVITVWRGPLPDAGVYRLYERLVSGGEVHHVHDGDGCQGADGELAPPFGVSVSHRRALDLGLGVYIMGPGA